MLRLALTLLALLLICPATYGQDPIRRLDEETRTTGQLQAIRMVQARILAWIALKDGAT